LQQYGFGGVSGAATEQFIDFAAVSSGAGVSAVYVSSASHAGGTLEVVSGGTTLAEVTLIGKYSRSSFEVISGISGSVAIVDPATAIAGGGMTPASTVIANSSPPINHVGASNVALFGSYMAALFASVEGAVSIQSTQATPNQPVLALPHAT
jgi:hypothetical protein